MEKIYDLMWLVNDYEQLKGRIWKFEFIFDSYFMSRHDEKIEYIKIISKSYWFIERLVREWKIDYWSEWWRDTPNYYESSEFWQKIVNDIEKLIIHLSIQDNPIEYLCSILKE